MKMCSRCKREQRASAFKRDCRTGGLSSQCRDCINARARSARCAYVVQSPSHPCVMGAARVTLCRSVADLLGKVDQ